MTKQRKERTSLRLRAIALVAGLAVGAMGVVGAYAGMWSGLPAASSSPTQAGSAVTLPLTGNETGAFDTNLSGGRNPQTETISVDQLKTYMYGNGGSASATPNTRTVASSGTATCNASRCVVESEALTTSPSAFYTLVLSNTNILSTSIVLASVGNLTNSSTGTDLRRVQPHTTGGAATITVKNEGGIAFNGAIAINAVVIN